MICTVYLILLKSKFVRVLNQVPLHEDIE